MIFPSFHYASTNGLKLREKLKTLVDGFITVKLQTLIDFCFNVVDDARALIFTELKGLYMAFIIYDPDESCIFVFGKIKILYMFHNMH